jgi:ribosome-binding protein aMBF1 (putative translation factor)
MLVMNMLSQHLADTGQSQSAFADEIGCDKSIVSRLTRYEMTPSLELAVKIERATHGKVPVEVWIDDKDVAAANTPAAGTSELAHSEPTGGCDALD